MFKTKKYKELERRLDKLERAFAKYVRLSNNTVKKDDLHDCAFKKCECNSDDIVEDILKLNYKEGATIWPRN